MSASAFAATTTVSASVSAARAPRASRAVSVRASAASSVAAMAAPAIAPFEFATASRTLFGCGVSKKVPSLVKELTALEGCADAPVLIVAGASD